MRIKKKVYSVFLGNKKYQLPVFILQGVRIREKVRVRKDQKPGNS